MDLNRLDAITRELTKALIYKGLLIEAGWTGFLAMVVPKDAPQIQKDEMRFAFFTGADHLFSSIMSTLDADAEPTAADVKRMDDIHRELEKFRTVLRKRAGH